jgi:hypothetical protein
MPKDATKAFVAADGTLYVGPTDAAAPTTATSTPDTDFVDMGGFDRDNLGLTPSRDENDYRFFGSFFPDLTIVTARGLQFTVTLAELTADALSLAFDGGDVTGSAGDWTYTPPDPRDINEKSVILDLFYGDKTHRWYFPRVKVSDVGQIAFQNENPTLVPLTFTVLQPASGDAFEMFTDDDTGFSST